MPISQKEFDLLRTYIKEQCGIAVGDEKSYLVESRLARLVAESGCTDFEQFYLKAKSDPTGSLRDKIVDAMTTNETLWFRDKTPWTMMEEHLLPALLEQLKSGKKNKIRIWSAACSTGQEPYSIAMLLDQLIKTPKWAGLSHNNFEITATDISPSALFLAISGRYNRIAMSRGLPEKFAKLYFQTMGPVSVITPDIKKRVTFKKYNLQTPFTQLGRFDFVLLRNVAIYFSETLKKDIFRKISNQLNPSGFFMLGASESLIGYSTDFDTKEYKRAIFYQLNNKH